MRRIAFILLLLIGSPSMGLAQERDVSLYNYPHNRLGWKTIESANFLVHFQEGNVRPAQVISVIAEEIYPDVVDLYKHKPDSKVSIVLNDRLDYANGAAYFFDNKIEIWLPALDTPLRGTHNWLRTVITHEFVHIVQIQLAAKQNRRWPASYVQWLSYEDVRRPDVLYGYPNGVITFPFANLSMPAWLAEGTAQYDREHLHYDYWDAHRDMILRTRILQGTHLSLEQMGTFSSKTSLERETTYNQGFAFTHWLAQEYGEDILRVLTEALAQPGVHDVSDALERATGTDGRELHRRWVAWLREFYTAQLQGRINTESTTLEQEGFFNFYPRTSSDGRYLAYLSNRGDDNARLSLILKDNRSGELTALADISAPDTHIHTLSCGFHAAPELKDVAGAYDFSPDGTRIAYLRILDNRFGERYTDVYIHTIGSKEKARRLTFSARIFEVRWHPDGERLIGVQFFDGSTNVVSISVTDGSVTPLTEYRHGEQVMSPSIHPDGQHVAFAFSDAGQREIRSIDLRTNETRIILADPVIDYRDPSWTRDARLLLSTNLDGLFNLHVFDPASGSLTPIGSEKGGAFQPSEAPDGSVVYSRYDWNGYHIAAIPSIANIPPQPRYERPFTPDALVSRAPSFDDTNPVTAEPKRYEDTFTSFSFFPAIRVDNYTKAYGNNLDLLKNRQLGRFGKNLWRDTKVGVYFASRDMIDRFSVFGGFMVGPGSRDANALGDFISPPRLVNLDRDIFLITEYRGLPFIKASWSPTVSVELYNMRRNVADGLRIEEFPCTACLPDTTSIDIAYDIWEARVALISKVNRYSLMELSYAHSPYRVGTEAFFSREYRSIVGGSTSRYYVGNALAATYTFDLEQRDIHSDIAPQGIKAYAKYQFQPSRLLEGYEIQGGALVPNYNEFRMHSIETDVRYGFKVADQRLRLHSRLYSNLNPNDEYFFLDYIGGFPGMRSYPFFALGGNTTWFGSLSWNIPLLTGLNRQVRQFTVDKVFARVFAETGNGWNTPLDTGNRLKSGIGTELRVSLNNSYLFPTRVFVSAAYGFDSLVLRLPDSFITSASGNRVTYGQEVLFNFGVLFDFDF